MLVNKLFGANAAAAAAGVEFVGAASDSDTRTLSFTGITDLQEGDLVFFIGVHGRNSFALTSSGWTVVSGNPAPNSTVNNSISNINCYKFMGSTPDTSIAFNRNLGGLTAVVFRGVGTPIGNGFEVTSGTNFFSSTTVTIANEGCVYLIGPMIDDDNSTISSVPSGFTIGAQAGTGSFLERSSVAILYQIGVPSGDLSGIGGSWSSSDSLATRGFEIPVA